MRGKVGSRDITGQKFNRLTAINVVRKNKHGVYWWLFKCDCGNEKVISRSCVEHNKIKSCGCLFQEYNKKIRREDITGQNFTYLTAIKFDDSWKNNRNWIFECKCGNIKSIAKAPVKAGIVVSCGCKKAENFNLHKYQQIKEPGRAIKNSVFSRYRVGAINRKIEFKLSYDEFMDLILKNCYYCGIEPCTHLTKPGAIGEILYNGIDRIDNDKGYELNNCVTCCKICNYAKRDLPISEFKNYIKRIINNNSQFKEDLVKPMFELKQILCIKGD